MLWTGGKDSSLALYEAERSGYRVGCLVTFAPPEPDFLAHPLGFIQIQARAMGLPHHVLPLGPPFESSYENSLCRLRQEQGIDCVVTGDIAEVNSHPNWMRQRGQAVGMKVHTPLWGRERDILLAQLLERGFKARFSCVNTRWLDANWVGRELTDSAIAELRRIRERTGLDLCGEEGEYHTLVTDGPRFSQAVELGAYSIRTAGPLAYMELRKVQLTRQTSARLAAGTT